MAISRAQLFKELLPGLNALFGLEYRRYGEEHKDIFSVESSDRSFEEELKLAGFGAAPIKTEGASVQYDTAQESYVTRYTHVTIAMGFALTEEAFEDNLYGSLSQRYTKALARSMAYTKQLRAAAILNDGFTTYNTGDGVTLFSTSHPLTGGGVNGNRVAADLNETALENALIAIQGWTDDRGLLVNLMARKLVIPRNLQFIAERLMATSLRPATADNDVNALKNMGMLPEGYVVNNFLTDTNGWFIKTDCPDGAKMFVRSPMKTGQEVDFDTGNMKYKARERYSFGVSDPLAFYGSSGSS